MMQSKQIIASLLSMLSKQVYTCSKDDAVKTNYCTTIFKQFWTYLKYDAINTNYCITIFKQFWKIFNYDTIMFGPVQKVTQWNKIIASLFVAGLGWPGLMIIASLFFNAYKTLTRFFFSKFFKKFPWQRSFKNRKSSRLKNVIPSIFMNFWSRNNLNKLDRLIP